MYTESVDNLDIYGAQKKSPALTARMIKRSGNKEDVRRDFRAHRPIAIGESLVKAFVPNRLRVLLATRDMQLFITTYTLAFGFFSVWLS